MKTADGFILKTIAGTNVVVPIGKATVSFRSMITLNDSGAFLWRQLEKGCTEEELVAALENEYNVDDATARADIKEFLATMSKADLLR